MAATLLTYKTIKVCSVYLEPHPLWVRGPLEQLPEPYLIVWDFNAHSCFWGNEKTDTRGQIIQDFIVFSNICLLKSGKPTYRSPSSRKMSCIDLSFSSPSIFNDFKWDVLDNAYRSDHVLVVVALRSSPAIIPDKPRRWKLHLAD